tara:strand:- start:325 stop:837 length:513 start_codon:yes stop_codon:yes gene_type:complete
MSVEWGVVLMGMASAAVGTVLAIPNSTGLVLVTVIVAHTTDGTILAPAVFLASIVITKMVGVVQVSACDGVLAAENKKMVLSMPCTGQNMDAQITLTGILNQKYGIQGNSPRTYLLDFPVAPPQVIGTQRDYVVYSVLVIGRRIILKIIYRENVIKYLIILVKLALAKDT